MGEETIARLESCFQRYGDAPPEAILKEDVLRLGMWFSQEALQACQGCRVKTYRLFSYDRFLFDKMSGQPNLKVPEEIKVEGGAYRLRPTVIQVRLNPSSPYLVDVVDGRITLGTEGIALADVEYPTAPQYYFRTFEDGTRYCDIIPLVSWYKPFITAFRSCQFWGVKEECRFCDINENVRQMKKTGAYTVTSSVKKVDQVKTVFDTIVNEEKIDVEGRVPDYIITGGTIIKKLNGLSEDDFYLQYVEATKSVAGGRWLCCLETVAKDEKALRQFRERGVDSFQANLEVWDERLFKILCPGKEKYIGRDEWIRRLVKGVDIFGRGKIVTNLVAGIEMAQPYGFQDVDEAVKSTAEGLDYLMGLGVMPKFNTWCVEEGSALGRQEPVPLDFLIKTARTWYELWNKHNIPLYGKLGPIGTGRALLGNTSMMDMGT